MISEEQEWPPAPDVDMADTHDLPAADPDPWEGGSIENEGPEPSQQDTDGPGADESEPGESESEDVGADGPQPGETGNEEQGNGNAGEDKPDGEEADGEEADVEEAEPTELKIVLHVRNGRANAGVWRPGADPHLEVFLETDPDVILNELPGLIERAKARWADNPMRPKYSPPKSKPTPKKQSKKGNKQAPKQSSGQPSEQPSGQPSGQPSEQPSGQPGSGEEQTGMARLF